MRLEAGGCGGEEFAGGPNLGFGILNVKEKSRGHVSGFVERLLTLDSIASAAIRVQRRLSSNDFRVLKNGGSSGDFSYCNNHLALWLLFSFSVGDVRNCLHATWVLWLQFYSPNSLLQATTVTKGFFKLKQLQVEMDNACLANKARLTQMNHFFEDAFHSSCEGIMVKSLDVEAGYLPSKRSYSWLKTKGARERERVPGRRLQISAGAEWCVKPKSGGRRRGVCVRRCGEPPPEIAGRWMGGLRSKGCGWGGCVRKF
ncbi:hypothetical protein E3N88_24407 [Mikania micrantha]|uniref:ATP-dependent DNA ligase family profile domain-containing protein n=1 Tax=Mikania micrantha TaxID=192012 RepID=A0A5N6N1S4_9ASTR|nr:hypothetical protein E3N88_24407 [Mikania micrantha]